MKRNCLIGFAVGLLFLLAGCADARQNMPPAAVGQIPRLIEFYSPM